MTTATNTRKVAPVTGANKGIGFETARQPGRLRLAPLALDGPTGAFFHKDQRLPW